MATPKRPAGVGGDKQQQRKISTRLLLLRIVFAAVVLRFAFDLLIGVVLEWEYAYYGDVADTVTDYTVPDDAGVLVAVAPENEERRMLEELHQLAAKKKQEQLVQQQRSLEMQKQPEEPEGPYEIVDTTSWAKPSAQYVVDTRDLWENDRRLPDWMVNYFRWHKESIQADWASRDVMLPDDQNFLWVTCLKEYNKCGGTADRLSSLPFFVKVAAQSHRILLFQWTKPAELERFLLPPLFGIDWRVPKAKVDALLTLGEKVGTQDTILETAPLAKARVLQVKFQSHDHGAVYYDSIRESDHEPRFDEVFHHVWKIFFTPAPAVALEIERTMSIVGLVPGGYTSAHVRALYAVEHRSPAMVNDWAQNAVQCALYLQKLRSDDDIPLPIFFASDTDAAARQAQTYGRARGVPVLTHHADMNAPKIDPLHLDKAENWGDKDASDFYDIFVDLYIMSMGQCVTFGQGGFGKFASLMSNNPSCSMYHMTATTTYHCPAPSAKLRKRRGFSKYQFRKEVPVGGDDNQLFKLPMPLHSVDKEFDAHKHTRLVVRSGLEKMKIHKPFPDFQSGTPATEAIWNSSTELPTWMKDYFAWHAQQRKVLTESGWKDSRFLVVTCLKSTKQCGGTADRLAPLPFLLRLAADTKRLLFIAWEKPRPLEEFLVPPQGGLDWRTPVWLLAKIELHGQPVTDDMKLIEATATEEIVVKATLHSGDYGSKYYDAKAMEGGETTTEAFREQYHDCWATLFTPVPAVASQIVNEMKSLGMRAGEFSFAHLRAYYDDENSVDESKLRRWTQNSLNCLSEVRPGGQYFFSSDSVLAKTFAVEYGREKGANVLVRQDSSTGDPLYLDTPKWPGSQASDYYPTFIDLYIMSFARCFSYNVGGIGKLANLMSGHGTTCSARHWTDGLDTETANKNGCPWVGALASSAIILPKLTVRQAVQFLPRMEQQLI